MCLLTSFGSKKLRTAPIIAHNIIIAIPSFIFPFRASITAHGAIAAPDPNIGNASTNDIPMLTNSGNPTFNPKILNIVNPINYIINDIKISVASAFK